MKNWLIAFLFVSMGITTSQAQFGSFGDVPIEINAEGETRFVGGVAFAENNVVINYGTTTIYADYAQYNPETRDVFVSGNVRIYREGRLFVGERAVYNLETKQVRTSDFRGDFYPFRFSADTVSSIGVRDYKVKDAIFTTSDSSKPDYHIRARTVRVYSQDRVVFLNAILYVGRVPIFWWPYLYQSLKEDTSFTITPGYINTWGAFLLTQYTFPIAPNISGQLRLDLRSKRGAAIGFEANFKYGKNDRNWGKFRAYYANDTASSTNSTSLGREPLDEQRYRVSLQHRIFITDDIYANIDINKLSDSRILEDFIPQEFRIDPQPDNVVTLTKWDDNYTLTAIARTQLNEFYDTTERLPELVLDIKRHALFNSPIFYEGETSVARLRRAFPTGSAFPNYEATRVDTFHQVLYPQTYFGWLSVIPRLGIRGTYYSETGHTEGETVLVTVDSLIPGGLPTVQPTLVNKLVTDDAVFRPVINAGFEASFKLSQVYKDVQSRMWGLDGLRHVIQPYTNFSFVYSGKDPSNIFQFDRLNPSTQLPPIDFPQFTGIDSIDNWTVWRWGVRNRLQTRRDGRTYNWFQLDTFIDVNIDRPDFGSLASDEGTFSNLFNKLKWEPLPWVTLLIDSQFPLLDKGFTQVNTSINVMVNKNLQINFGHRYIKDNLFFADSSLLTFGGYYRINDNWGFSLLEQYELEDGVLESQRYELHRDLSSWIGSLGVILRDNRGVNDFGVLLTFTLKDFPQVSVPVAFDPQGTGPGGTR